jgi:cell division protein FtsL
MKPCPLCREEIQDDAIKCRHCQSLLIPMDSNKGETQDQSTRITYILDRDLVRFAKFAGAVLGVLLVAGTYLFGFRLESALDEMNDAQEELSKTEKELAAAKQTVSNLKRDVEQVLQEARVQLGSITETKRRADELYIAISSQRPGEAESASKGTELALKLWRPGTTISVGFFDGSESTHAAVEKIAREWTKYANINFRFVVGVSDANIRVSFSEGGSWSYVGTDSLVIPKNQPTMALIESGVNDKAFRSSVLRQFGLVL